jgi:hypothetical protein
MDSSAAESTYMVLEIVDKAQSFVNISEVTHLYIAIVDVVNNNATYTYVTQ